jgi:hypothetical protein
LPDLILNVHEPRRPRRIAAVEHDLHLAQVERFADALPFAQAAIAAAPLTALDISTTQTSGSFDPSSAILVSDSMPVESVNRVPVAL